MTSGTASRPGCGPGAFSRARGGARVRPGPGCGEYARHRGVLLRVGDGSQGVGRGPGGLGGHCRVTRAGPGTPGASGRRRGAPTHSGRQPTPHPCPRQTTPRQQAAPPVSASPHPSSWATPAPPRDHYTQGPRHHAGPDRPGPGPVPRTTNKVTGSWGQTLRKSQGLSASTHSGGQPSTPGGVHSGGETCGLSAGFSPPVGGPVENNAVVFPQVCAQLWMNHSGVLPQIHSLEQTCG